METITPTALAEASGISLPYASQIISGKRTPARSLAIHILRTTGWRHGSIAKLTDEQISTLESVDPWVPRASPEAA
ncbi:helix-turn-helix transcriptional regulator [Novosphingobium sp. EMRT-2]|uniref:helix-turn-helix domain-containing protein n=1 Tax=Novosphingobium sp. EMRT-2 TaxID=2571749 RepID=UPI00143CC126|nr:helix-turn-helix transcriptional regulator [Novosphingobium sp. EMRT-2]